MQKVAADLRWLAVQLRPEAIGGRPVHAFLTELNNRLGYREVLLRSSGDEALGRAKAGAVDALLRFGLTLSIL